MNTKLTLTIEQSLIQKAKEYAKNKDRSLSDIIESYLKAITKKEDDVNIELTPIVKSLRGSIKAPDSFDYKKELTNSLSEKYI